MKMKYRQAMEWLYLACVVLSGAALVAIGDHKDPAQIPHLARGADLEAAWAIGEIFPDQNFSIVDRTSFKNAMRGKLKSSA